jgi:hypothetical protein
MFRARENSSEGLAMARKHLVLVSLVTILMFAMSLPAQARGRDTKNRDDRSEVGCATSFEGPGQAARGAAADNDNAQALYCDFGTGKQLGQ